MNSRISLALLAAIDLSSCGSDSPVANGEQVKIAEGLNRAVSAEVGGSVEAAHDAIIIDLKSQNIRIAPVVFMTRRGEPLMDEFANAGFKSVVFKGTDYKGGGLKKRTFTIEEASALTRNASAAQSHCRNGKGPDDCDAWLKISGAQSEN